ncbi:MAG: sodium:solute symporter [Clostridia bacterium]|nr:sodium:solute symporter [Clostridia bacterium]
MNSLLYSFAGAAHSKLAPTLMLIIYIAMMVVIAFYSRKKSRTLSSYFLGDRGIGGWMAAFSYGTTYFSAVVFVGYAGKFGMSMGLSAIWIGIANAFFGSLFAWWVLAKRTRKMTRVLNTRTMPEFFEKRYNNKYIKLVSSIIIFIFLIPYSTSVYQGLGYLFERIFGIDFYWCIAIMALMTALYLFFGGYFATVLSDFIQGIIMVGGVIVMLILMMRAPEVNGAEGLRTLSDIGYGFFPGFNAASGKLIDSAGFNLIIIILLTSFGIWAMPQSVHKFYTIKNNAAIRKGAVISTVFALIIGGGAYFNGGFSRLFFPGGFPAGGADAVVPEMLLRANFSGAMLGLIMVLLLSASMSTLSSLALSGSSALVIDGYKGYVDKKASENKIKGILRVVCLIFVIVSALLAALKIDAIVTLMSISWGCLAGCFIGPFIYGLYSRKITSAAAMVSIISGVTITVIMTVVFGLIAGATGFGGVIKAGIQRAPLTGVICMIFSMIITPVVSIFTKKPDKEHLDRCFSEAE